MKHNLLAIDDLMAVVRWDKRDGLWTEFLAVSCHVGYRYINGELIGFGRLVCVLDSNHKTDKFVIYDLVVHTKHQRQSIGSGLVKEFFGQAHQISKRPKVYVEAMPESIAFFEHLGFQYLHQTPIDGRIFMKIVI